MKVGINSGVFMLFFGMSLVEAFQVRNWLLAGIFLSLGFFSLWADNKRKSK